MLFRYLHVGLWMKVLFEPASCDQNVSGRLPLPATIVHQYPNPTWIENIAVRPNGNLLLTIFNQHQLYELNPSALNSTKLIYEFPNVDSVTGIVEIEHDVYVLAAGNFSLSAHSGILTSWSFWKIDFNGALQDPTTPYVTKLLDVPEAQTLNGLTALSPEIVLAADAGLNATWRLNVSSLDYNLAIDVPEMTPPISADRDEGVNGIHVACDEDDDDDDTFLYWTNSEAATFYRIEIDPVTGSARAGARARAIANVGTFMDDFTFDAHGNAWIVTDSANTLIVVPPEGRGNQTSSIAPFVTLDGSLTSMMLAGGTACAFGRRAGDSHVLYVVTNGGLTSPVNGTVTEGGKVVAIDTRGFNAI